MRLCGHRCLTLSLLMLMLAAGMLAGCLRTAAEHCILSGSAEGSEEGRPAHNLTEAEVERFPDLARLVAGEITKFKLAHNEWDEFWSYWESRNLTQTLEKSRIIVVRWEGNVEAVGGSCPV